MSGGTPFDPCRVCNGRGKRYGSIKCRSCGGTGQDKSAQRTALALAGAALSAGVERFRDDDKEREIWPKGTPIACRAGFVTGTPTTSSLTWSLQWDETGYAECFLSDSGERASDYDCAVSLKILGLHPVKELNASTQNQSILRGWQVKSVLETRGGFSNGPTKVH